VSTQRVRTSRGELALRQEGEHFEIVSNGVFLMDTRDGRSERLLATAALAAHHAPANVLIGGLGVGFTLRAALTDDRVAAVTVVEVEPAIVEWQRAQLAGFSGRALDDPRVNVVVADLRGHLASARECYDVICVDVDNGPDWTVADDNTRLYDAAGTALLRGCLRDDGVLAVWAARPAPRYEDVLRGQFADVTVHEVPVARGEPDVVYVARTSNDVAATHEPGDDRK
jgi:spermidine synthase